MSLSETLLQFHAKLSIDQRVVAKILVILFIK